MKNFLKKKGILIPFLFFVLFLLVFRPVKLTTDNDTKFLYCWAWDKGLVHFTNSVTGGDVKIKFSLLWGFRNFKMITDEKTEDYYTSGTYNINDLLKKEYKRKMFFCSIIGMTIKIGRYNIKLKNNCATMEMLWPPRKIF